METPILIPAPAPEANIDAPRCGHGYLHTSPELAMKRLLASGYENIFQICKCFREGERGSLHLPEFTMLEWYRRGGDYRDLMADCRDLLAHLAAELGLGDTLLHRGQPIKLTGEWEELTILEAFDRYAGVTAWEALEAGDFDLLISEKIEPNLGRNTPAILKDYPAKCAALARLKVEDPSVAERFELYIDGIELANGFSELSDPKVQRERFDEERLARGAAGKDPYPMPEVFLEDLAHMGEACGIALGIDRLVMLFAGAREIDGVVAFTREEL